MQTMMIGSHNNARLVAICFDLFPIHGCSLCNLNKYIAENMSIRQKFPGGWMDKNCTGEKC